MYDEIETEKRFTLKSHALSNASEYSQVVAFMKIKEKMVRELLNL
jgi:hypothetical protein